MSRNPDIAGSVIIHELDESNGRFMAYAVESLDKQTQGMIEFVLLKDVMRKGNVTMGDLAESFSKHITAVDKEYLVDQKERNDAFRSRLKQALMSDKPFDRERQIWEDQRDDILWNKMKSKESDMDLFL